MLLRKRLMVVALSIVMVSVFLFSAYILEGRTNDSSIDGSWELAFYRGYDLDGDYVEWISEDAGTSDVLFIVDGSPSGRLSGTIDGICFTGAIKNGVFNIYPV